MASRVLSFEEIQESLAEARFRGLYLEKVTNFFESGELAKDFTEEFPKKEASSLRNSIDQNCKKVENHPEYKVMVVKNGDEADHVILVNMDVYHLAEQEKNEA